MGYSAGIVKNKLDFACFLCVCDVSLQILMIVMIKIKTRFFRDTKVTELWLFGVLLLKMEKKVDTSLT